MPIGDDNIKQCICCGKVSFSYELFFICSKCINSGHTGVDCEACKKEKESDEKLSKN